MMVMPHQLQWFANSSPSPCVFRKQASRAVTDSNTGLPILAVAFVLVQVGKSWNRQTGGFTGLSRHRKNVGNCAGSWTVEKGRSGIADGPLFFFWPMKVTRTVVATTEPLRVLSGSAWRRPGVSAGNVSWKVWICGPVPHGTGQPQETPP